MGGKVTEAERAWVERLRAEGRSIRAIAEEVFGSQRYRGRVERVLSGAERTRPGLAGEAAGVPRPELTGLEGWGALRALFEWRVAVWAASESPPSMTQLQAMVKVHGALEAAERIERLRRLTREP